jgi:hypothetical protein
MSAEPGHSEVAILAEHLAAEHEQDEASRLALRAVDVGAGSANGR